MRNPVSRFAYSHSDIGIKRSIIDRSQDHKTTMSAGKLYPLLVEEIYPGDTYSVDMSSLIRMSTPIHPVADNAFIDTYWFFVPNLISWDHWREFMGESNSDFYTPNVEYSVPALIPDLETDPSEDNQLLMYSGIPPKSILDYMGIPSRTMPERINALPLRGFNLIWNNWFRSQQLQNCINVYTGDSDVTYATMRRADNTAIGKYWHRNEEDGDYYVVNSAHGGDLPPVNKYHDYFTSALIEPQRGDPVPIPLSGFAPVYANSLVDITSLGIDATKPPQVITRNGNPLYEGALVTDTNGNLKSGYPTSGSISHDKLITFKDLGADLSNLVGGYASINDLRYAFQMQKYLEAENRSGSRYRELLKAHFDVTSPDASLYIPEFLGGKRIPVSISQVLQTSATNDVSPQGNTAAYSLTSDKYSAFTKSFTQHGFLFCVGCIRTEHTYAQGLERMWSRFNKFDYYFPEFANISEQPILRKEIYNKVHTASATPESVQAEYGEASQPFGFQEAWAELRYKPNRVSAEMSPTYPQSLDSWHYADYYEDAPQLSSEWIQETRRNIDRTLAVSSDIADQFICDFYFKMQATRVLPITSIPGLADHH